MGLIKSTAAPPSLTPFSLADIERRAKVILFRAQQRAEALLAAAQAEGESIKQEAHAEGLAVGRREGLAQGLEQGRQTGQQTALNEHRAELQQAMNSLTGALKAIDSDRADLEATALAEVVRLAIAIAARVTKRQGLIDPGVLTANLAESMKLVVQSTDVRLAIHPQQRATLDAALPELRLQWPKLSHMQLTDDPTLAQGGCRLFTEDGQIDADLSVQLDRIVSELLPLSILNSMGASV